MESYQQSIKTIIQTLAVDPEKGLSSQEVEKRQKQHGYNILKEVKQRGIIGIFISQFQNPLVYILFFAAVIIFMFGEDKLDAFIISGVLFFNATLLLAILFLYKKANAFLLMHTLFPQPMYELMKQY